MAKKQPKNIIDFKGKGRTSVKRELPKSAPLIKLGDQFTPGHEKEWPHEKQVSHLRELASSMNQALDIMQKERDQLNEIAKRQEGQLIDNKEKYIAQGQLMHNELQKQGAEQQRAYTEIDRLVKENLDLKHRIAVLESKLEKV